MDSGGAGDEVIEPEHAGRVQSSLSRRRLLQGAGGLAGAFLLPEPVLTRVGEWLGPSPAVASPGAKTAICMAMHVHSSFSEGTASVQSQMSEAHATATDVLWLTDHDWRMSAHGYRQVVHFDSLSSETEVGTTHPWKWVLVTEGKPSLATGGIVTSPISPKDPSSIAGALHVVCQGNQTGKTGSARFSADTSKARWNERSNLAGQSMELEVMPTALDENS